MPNRRMHSSRMRTARLLTVSCSAGGCRPLDADPPDTDPPGHVTCDACWEVNTPPPVDRQTPVRTLPSFAGGNDRRGYCVKKWLLRTCMWGAVPRAAHEDPVRLAGLGHGGKEVWPLVVLPQNVRRA